MKTRRKAYTGGNKQIRENLAKLNKNLKRIIQRTAEKLILR